MPLRKNKTFDYLLDCTTLGLLVYSKGNILGLFPPLTIDESIADEITAALGEVFTGSLAAKTARKLRIAKELASVKLKKS